MKKHILLLIFTILLPFIGRSEGVFAATYAGRVVDEKGVPVPYATVYPEIAPEWGTATNNDGFFSFEANLTPDMRIIVSYIGYEKKTVLAQSLHSVNPEDGLYSVILKEQPIALQETVIAAKPAKQKNKRKAMAALLHAVYVKLEEEFPDNNAQYQVVSDVRMQSGGSTWGMEQMIANVVVLPEAAKGNQIYFQKESETIMDSIQWQGLYCKRFFSAEKRKQADSLLTGNLIERLEEKSKTPDRAPKNYMRKAVNSLDSGMIVHRSLFIMGNMLYDFKETMNDIKHWTVSNESENETVLTHTQKINKYLGFFKLTFSRNYILDSRTYEVLRFSEHAEVKITIPFGYKLNKDQLQILNLLNMNDEQITKFRIRKARAVTDYNTFYQRIEGKLYIREKNLVSNSVIIGSRNAELPISVHGTQHVTSVRTKDISPLMKSQINSRLAREIVEIY